MIDRTTATENPDLPAREGAEHLPDLTAAGARDEDFGAVAPLLAALEERVRRLEDALAQLQDTNPMEARIASRVLEQVGREAPVATPEPAGTVRQSAAIMLETGRQLLPAAVSALQAHAAAAEARAAAAPAGKRPWLIVDLFADVRTLYRMCRDPLYRTVWLPRALLPLGLLALIFTSGVWLYLVPGFGLFPKIAAEFVDKVVDLVLAFIFCKALQREIRRYRDTLPDQTPARRP